MTSLVLYDDAAARDFAPFALTRPAGELRAGAFLTRERWVRLLAASTTSFVGAPHLRDFVEPHAPGACVGQIAAGSWVVNARCVPTMSSSVLSPGVESIRVAGRVAAVKLRRDLPLVEFADGALDLASLVEGEPMDAEGRWLEKVWDLVAFLPAMLGEDASALVPLEVQPRGITVLGEHPVHVEDGARIEPFVVADSSAGPVVVRRGAHVMSFTRLVGPCVIGEDSTVMGGRIASCSIGPQVKVSGEMSVVIVIGQANKGHDGFVGHSVIGRWANLGAGTITSNLKNSYGEVSMWTPTGSARTGQQFLGALIGDHAKTGIGTRLSTGSVVGAAANVFGSRMPPKYVAPFAWGDGEPWDIFDVDRFLTVATRVMARRRQEMPASGPEHWARIFAARDGA